MSKLKKVIVVLMIVAMAFALAPGVKSVDAATEVSNFETLKTALTDSGNRRIIVKDDIKITSRIKLGSGNKYICAPLGKTYKIYRDKDSANTQGYLMEVPSGATLYVGTKDDSNGNKYGNIILGGNSGNRDRKTKQCSLVNVTGGTFRLSPNGTMQNNIATESSGGAIRATGASTIEVYGTIKDCVAYESDDNNIYNSISSGGAIYAEGSSNITLKAGCTINNCSTKSDYEDASEGNGGAIWFKGNALAIEGGTFTNNKSIENGGFLEFLGKTCTITGGTFSNNKAIGADNGGKDTDKDDDIKGNGGVIKVNCSGRVNILGGTFSGNKAGNGGVLHCTYSPVINVAKGLFEGNSANNHGGAFRVSTGTMYFAENAIARNNTAKTGGAISNAGKLQSWYANGGNPIVENNTATKKGGGIYNEGTFTSSSIYIRGNYACSNRESKTYTSNNYGGGLFNAASGKIERFAGHITGNKANCGAGIANDGKIDTGSWHETLEIANNEAQSHSGGLYNAGYVYISSTALTIHNNKAIKNWGGGIFNTASGYLRLIDGKIYGNTASENGGAVNNSSTNNLILENITMYNNTASRYGGGIYSSGNMTLNASTIYNNEANNSGGGLYNSGTANVWGNTYIGKTGDGNQNKANNGGGVYNTADGTINFGAVKIHNNEATGTTGGGIHNAGTIKCTGAIDIAGNKSPGLGAGFYNTGTYTHDPAVSITYNPNIYITNNECTGTDASTAGLVNTGIFTVVEKKFNDTSLSPNINIQNNTAKWFGVTNSGNITISAPYNVNINNNISREAAYQINNNSNSSISISGANVNIGSTTVTSGSQEMGAIQNGGTFNITSSSGNISGCRNMTIRNLGYMTVAAKSGDNIYIGSSKDGGEIVHNGGNNASAMFNARGSVRVRQGSNVTTNNAINNENGATLNLYDGSTIEVSYAGAMMNGTINYGIYNAGVVNSYANIIRFKDYGIYNTSTGTATVKGGSIETSYAYYSTGEKVGVQNEGTLTVDGGKISFNDIGINNKGTMNLNGGNVESNMDHGIYNITGATINQTGGTIKNNNSKNGIYLETGSKYNVSKDASVDTSNYVYESSGTYINIVSPGLNISESDGIRFNVLPEIADLGRVIATTNFDATGESQLYAKGDAEAERSGKDYSKVFSITSDSFILRPGNRLSKGFDKLHTSSDNKGCEGEVLNSTGQSRNGAIYLSEKYNITYNPNKPEGVTGEVGNMPGTKNTNGKYYDTKFWNEDYTIVVAGIGLIVILRVVRRKVGK